MTNPYTSSPTLETDPSTKRRLTSTMQWIAVAVSLFAILVLLVTAGILIPQAIRFGNEGANLPPRLQGSAGSQSIAKASWIGGITAVVGIVMNIVALFLIRGGRAIVSISIAAASIALLIVIAIVYKPI